MVLALLSGSFRHFDVAHTSLPDGLFVWNGLLLWLLLLILVFKHVVLEVFKLLVSD